MKIAFLTFLACFLAANAACMPHQHGVTTRDIDILISDAVHFLKSWIIKHQPFKTTDMSLNLKNSNLHLKANLKDLEWLLHGHEGSFYSESSSMSDHDLSLSALLKQSLEYRGKLELVGTLNGKPFEKTGDFKYGIKSVIDRLILKAEFTPQSFKMVDLSFTPDLSPVEVEISGLDVDQSTKETIQKLVQQSLDDSMSKAIEESKKTNRPFIQSMNKLTENHSLQEVYDFLRGMIPRVEKGSRHFGHWPWLKLFM